MLNGKHHGFGMFWVYQILKHQKYMAGKGQRWGILLGNNSLFQRAGINVLFYLGPFKPLEDRHVVPFLIFFRFPVKSSRAMVTHFIL
jgi:hypothetical protein